MPQVIFTAQFRYSPNGYDVVTYPPADTPVEVSEECASIAISIDRARIASAPKPTPKPQRGGKKP